MRTGLLWFIRMWRRVVSPVYGDVCRYYPSCSAYGLGAVSHHGALSGSWLIARRLARCHPFDPGGVDLPPPPGEYRWWGRWAGSCGDTEVIQTVHDLLEHHGLEIPAAGQAAFAPSRRLSDAPGTSGVATLSRSTDRSGA